MPVVRRLDRLVLGAFLATVVIGGANSIAVRISLRELPPIWGAAFRFALATMVVAVLAVALRKRWPSRDQALPILGYGLLNFGLTYVFLYGGLRDAPAGTAAVVTAVAPLLTLIFAVVERVERFRPAALVGSLIAFAGIGVIFANQISLNVPLVALLALVGAAACLAQTSVMVKRFPPGDPLVAVAFGIPIGGICLAVLSIVVGERWFLPVHLETWLANAYLVVFGTIISFSATLYILSHWTASANSYAFLLSPLVTVVLGGLILGEAVEPAFALGGALVLLGVYVGVVVGRRRDAPIAVEDSAPAP